MRGGRHTRPPSRLSRGGGPLASAREADLRTAAVLTFALAALAAAAPARAQYAPPGMTFGPAAPPPASTDPGAVATTAATGPAFPAPPAQYAPPGMTFGPAAAPAAQAALAAEAAPSRWEWAFGAGAGRRSWPWGQNKLYVDLEGTALARLDEAFVAGILLTQDSAAALAGWRTPLSPALRLDLLADAGVMALGALDPWWAPVTGARAGIAWIRPQRRRAVTLGVAVRRAWAVGSENVCDVGGSCGREPRPGATFVGGILTYGSVGVLPSRGSAGQAPAEGGRVRGR